MCEYLYYINVCILYYSALKDEEAAPANNTGPVVKDEKVIDLMRGEVGRKRAVSEMRGTSIGDGVNISWSKNSKIILFL